MNKLAVEIKDQDERLTKEFKTMEYIAMLTDAIASANTKDVETSEEDHIIKIVTDM